MHSVPDIIIIFIIMVMVIEERTFIVLYQVSDIHCPKNFTYVIWIRGRSFGPSKT